MLRTAPAGLTAERRLCTNGQVSEAPPPPPDRSQRKSAPSEARSASPDGDQASQSFADIAGEATQDTRILQERLRAAGVYSGDVDGVYGPSTVDAVRRLQLSYGLQADGLAGPQTIELLDRLGAGASRPVDEPTQQRQQESKQEQAQSVTPEPDARPEPTPPRSFLPRFSADDLNGQDLLERRGKVEFLASVLAARELETPLAIGLFGDWGSGKSFFMRRLQERIVELTEASAQAVAAHEQTLYCSQVRHVNFNAWLHSGTDIWPAFAAQVFRGVAGLDTEAPQGATQADALAEYQEKLRADQARSERIRQLEQQVDAKKTELRTLEPQVGGPAGKFVGTVREIVARLLGLRDGWRDLRAADVLLLVAIGLTIAAFALFDRWMAWIAAGAAALLAVLRYLDEPRRLRQELRELEADLATEQQAQADRGIAGAGDARPELLLPEFARREAAEWTERAQVDAVTQIRMKFDQLSRLIAAGIHARVAVGDPAPEAVPIERVIVYVDDLDRCQHDVVVGVLETLKLLVSLPHFVAVVGVDSRWLFRSLQLHFRELLRSDDDGATDAAWAATPQNYLEKVFQYSLVLQPISSVGFANLIEELLATEEVAPPVGLGPDAVPGPPQPQDTGATGAASQPGAAAVPDVDLTPAELLISREEVEFVKGLAPMFETPRAAKRLANVYRLLRVSVGADRLMEAESFEPTLVLLSIGIGFPGLAGETFAAIWEAGDGRLWPEFVEQLPAEDEARRKLQDALRRASCEAMADRELSSFRPWIRDVAEFSFHPWQELLPATTTS
jgi:peptidoglycan hydrolase-like protein with peptidoglycan-binding domain